MRIQWRFSSSEITDNKRELILCFQSKTFSVGAASEGAESSDKTLLSPLDVRCCFSGLHLLCEPSRQTLDTGKLRSEVFLQRGCSTQAEQTAVTPGVRKMDGDSSTTDASQLGIAGDYIGGSHYVIQPHDDTEDSMNDHEDTNGSKESFREQDIYLPIANVARIMKNAIPQTGKIAKDAKECVQECVSEFISFITSEASERCHQEKRKTINGEDILFAMSTLGFDSYVEPLKLYLQKFREAMKGEKGIGGTVTTGDGLSEELTEEAFTNQLPAGLITTDGQQQNVMVYTTSYQQISGVQQIQFS